MVRTGLAVAGRTAADVGFLCKVRAAVYGLLSRLYLSPPDAAVLDILRYPNFLADWPLARGHPQVEAGLAALTTALPGAEPAQLTEEYRRLFLGPGPVLAPPWESVYLDREHVIFGEDTLRVRRLFHRYGLEFRSLHREPDDHIGLQLEFLATLSAQAATAAKQGDSDAMRHMLSGQRACLEEHLLRWVPQFTDLMLRHATSQFYRGLASLTAGTLEWDCGELCQRLRAGG